MKYIKTQKTFYFFSLLFLLFFFNSCSHDEDNNNISVTDITLTKSSTTVAIGRSEQLIATIEPTHATNQNLRWSSSDTGIATVSSSGVVTGVAVGSTIITVITEDGNFTATCNVNVVATETFDTADTPGDYVTVTAGSTVFNMIYSNNQSSITFPIEKDDSDTATLTRKFFMSQTVVTNALMAEVLQWAYDSKWFAVKDGYVDSNTVDYGGQQLLDLSAEEIKISYAAGIFSVDPGFENHPVVFVTWYGTVMFCIWLTWMTEGDDTNMVYSGVSDSWADEDTVEDPSQTGYRLPSMEEWEFAARYIGQMIPTAGDLATEYVTRYYNGGSALLTPGYYWTPGDYASGAIRDCTNEQETRDVSWYSGMPGGDELKPVAEKLANQLGIYDMSGNVFKWCFTVSAEAETKRVTRGGGWQGKADYMRVSFWGDYAPDFSASMVGFHFAKTQ